MKKIYGFILNTLITSLRTLAEHEIVHGDIKPDNISDAGQFLDFGGSAIKPKDDEMQDDDSKLCVHLAMDRKES